MSKALVHKGSTKDVFKKGNNYLFRFSDRYSVFDWGEMPDHLTGKGAALAQFTKSIYKYLGEKGIKHHLIDEACAANEIIVTPFEVVRDLSPLTNKENVFIPLEVIFRLGVAKGSSLLKRSDKYRELEMFDTPMVEFTTKLERFDRPLTHEEAKAISGLSDQEWQSLLSLTRKIAIELKILFAASGITLWDGKIELALGKYQGTEREIILVDSIGPDELRLSRDEKQLSKEAIRQFYRNTQWYQLLDRAKAKYGEAFKDFISPPPALPQEFKRQMENMYLELAGIVSSVDSGRLNILILGSGGREHALAWRTAQDSSVEKVYVWPGNAGISGEKIVTLSEEWNKENFETVLNKHQINFVIPGAEQFMYQGVSDWCLEFNVNCFGPSKKAAQLEESKLFAKELMNRAGVPTAPFIDLTFAFQKNIDEALSLVEKFKQPVIKISGPALGKGVFVCKDSAEAKEVLIQLKEFPVSGIEAGLLVEEGLTGKEVSVFFACNGTHYSYLGSAQDHKRLLDGDQGPNTGGMGTISPVPWANGAFIKEVEEKFLVPTLKAMAAEGNPFKGILFLGLMVEGKEMNLLEYNVRFGDPETQVLLPLIDGDFSRLLFNMTRGNSSQVTLKPLKAVHIVKAARGYPGTFGGSVEKGKTIKHLPFPSSQSHLFYAGVKKNGNDLITNGGRVLGVTTLGNTLEQALGAAYETIGNVSFEGEQFRTDIGRNL